MRLARLVSLPLLTATIALACGDDGAVDPAPPDTTTADTSGGDAASSDTTTIDTTGLCENECLNEYGKNDKRLCPEPQAEWNCVDGCCEPVFKCQTDADCATRGFEEEQCTDDRFACHCQVSDGSCFSWFCGGADDCADGEICVAGACKTAPALGGLVPRILDAHTVLVEGATTELHVDLIDPNDADIALAAPAGSITWSSADSAVASVTGGVVTGGASAGTTDITATLSASGAQATWAVRNILVDPGDTLTVIVVDDQSVEPLSGKVVIAAAGAEPVAFDLPADGVFRYDGALGAGVDLHVFADNHDWVSWLALDSTTVLYLPIPRTVWSRIEKDPAGDILASETILDNSGIVTGTPQLGLYDKEGAFELTLSSFALSTALFDFNLQVLLGADVKQYLVPDHHIPQVDASEPMTVPGGITFGLAGPALPDFVLGAPKGTQRLWTLGGNMDLNQISEYSGEIVDSIGGGDLDLSKILTAVFPLFANFWSAYVPDVEVTTVGDPSAVVTVDPVLKMPMGLSTSLDIPALPTIGDLGWADSLFILGGALSVDGAMIPLGLNGGADTSNKETNPADGIIDSDERTPEKDPFILPLAMLHSGLQSPYTRYLSAIVAVSIPGKNDPRPDAGSAIFARGEAGSGPPAAPDLGEFLALPIHSTWAADTRAATIEAVPGADTQRLLFKGKRGEHWTIWLNGQASYTVPTPSTLVAGLKDRASEELELVFVNSLDLAEGQTLDAAAAPGGLTLSTLLNEMDRVSFINIREPIALGE